MLWGWENYVVNNDSTHYKHFNRDNRMDNIGQSTFFCKIPKKSPKISFTHTQHLCYKYLNESSIGEITLRNLFRQLIISKISLLSFPFILKKTFHDNRTDAKKILPSLDLRAHNTVGSHQTFVCVQHEVLRPYAITERQHFWIVFFSHLSLSLRAIL